MSQETWLVITVGAGFLLLGIAASPLGWAALLHRRSRAEREADRRFQELTDQLHALRSRVDRLEASTHTRNEKGVAAAWHGSTGSHTTLPPGPIARRRTSVHPGTTGDHMDQPKLIAVPKLPAAEDRQSMQSGLSQRYAAIWELSESGATPDAIARATGQPIGQIELILGLRRQIDASSNGK